MDLPLGLVNAIESGRCVLFLGAGIGYSASDARGNPLPDGQTLAVELAEKYGIDAGPEPELAKVSQLVEFRKGRPNLIAFLKAALDGAEPDEDLKWLLSLTWAGIFTTNYDSLITRCYELNTDPTQTPVVIATNSEVKTFDPRFEVPVYHLHGSLETDGGRGALLITEQDYALFHSRRDMLFETFRLKYATTPVLYIGYSHNDPNWRMVTAEVRMQLVASSPPPSYRLAPSTPDIDREILRGLAVETLDGSLSDFREAVTTSLGDLRVEPASLASMSAKIPTELRTIFDEHPAGLARLLNSWTYVNQADFQDSPNTSEFLKGSAPNWALVGQGKNFQRDLEVPFVDEILDFVTAQNPGMRVRVILGPAGYGVSTLLMAISAWSARNRAGTVLHLKASAQPWLSDMEFAVSQLAGPTIFVIDDASEYADEVAMSVQRIRDLKKDAYILLGDRLNEWRQRKPKIHGREYPLEPLSDDEIFRLLEMLERQDALGQLRDLGASLRFSAVKVRNQQELLVTMREVTDGRAFDAIIEDEYRSIQDDTARDMYGVVCAFSRVRATVRDFVLADTLGINVADVYGESMAGTEGTITFDDVDEARQITGARARHHIIAEIVWQRCVTPLFREKLMLNALGALNLTFGVDAKAFDLFTRDDSTVDSLQSLEGRMKFFESACRKDPTNAYVRQHYARMLRREGSFEAALTQIEKALEMNPRGRTLWHTKGTLLRDMALDAKLTVDFARRRVAQSEAAFTAALRLNSKDEYSYQGLAILYLGWARRMAPHSAAESIDYVQKSEEAIRGGLAVVRDKDSLYIASSEIEKFLGDVPSSIAELRKAVIASPQSGIASYLLGMALARSGEYVEAERVLSGAMLAKPDDPRLARALALILIDVGKSNDEAVAVLKLASLSGMSDANFICVYGGMLAMSGHVSEAEALWERANQKNWSVSAQSRVGYKPQGVGGDSLWLSGVVAKVKSGFAFISSSGYPDFFVPARRYGGIVMREGLALRFKPGFSVRGPVANDVELQTSTPH